MQWYHIDADKMVVGRLAGRSLLLVDYTGRLFLDGKARISAEVAGILDRIGSGAEGWQVRMEARACAVKARTCG